MSVLVVVLAGLAGAVLKFRTTSISKVQVAPKAAPEAESPATNPAHVVEVPAEVASANDPTLCVEAYFPKGAFTEQQELKFFCAETDAWRISEKVLAALTETGKPESVEAWNQLGHYELGIVGAIRAACCVGAKPLTANVPSKACGSVTDALAKLGPEPVWAGLDTVHEAFSCLAARKVRLPKRWEKVTNEAAKHAVGVFFPALSDDDAPAAEKADED